eukprot:TRINITY_DN31784_c0_g1_i1.p1 TRINITY_DN31784_c0_g1~~TRINITY_DN31784_c0_g1_i1.p1  ORF type:complete len:352 (+),score=84.23 TRINITY_DN31784_c0_g1_i1:81-1058(+)
MPPHSEPLRRPQGAATDALWESYRELAEVYGEAAAAAGAEPCWQAEQAPASAGRIWAATADEVRGLRDLAGELQQLVDAAGSDEDQLRTAEGRLQELMEGAQASRDVVLESALRRLQGDIAFAGGDPMRALAHMDHSLALYERTHRGAGRLASAAHALRTHCAAGGVLEHAGHHNMALERWRAAREQLALLAASGPSEELAALDCALMRRIAQSVVNSARSGNAETQSDARELALRFLRDAREQCEGRRRWADAVALHTQAGRLLLMHARCAEGEHRADAFARGSAELRDGMRLAQREGLGDSELAHELESAAAQVATARRMLCP